MNKFEELSKLNVNDKTETKDGLKYLSWAWAWAEFKKVYPEAEYEVVKFDGLPYAYDTNTGYMVYTKVTAEGVTHEMWLPVMDGANHAMKAETYEIQTKYKTISVKPATMFDVNKAIMRCLTKNLAMFGLGLYIYAGEDLPEEPDVVCPQCGNVVAPITKKSGKRVSPAEILKGCGGVCYNCYQAQQNGGNSIFTDPNAIGEAQ